MNEADAWTAVKKALKPKRFEHTERVVLEAERLQLRYGGDAERIRLAAVIHDYGKYRPAEEMRETIRQTPSLPDDLAGYGEELLHAFAGAVYLKKELGITDPTVLDAVTYHTTGRAGMTVEEKIVFLADYIEPGRTFQEADKVRAAAESSLDKACFLALKYTILFLAGRSELIYPYTFEAYNDLQRKL